MKAKFDPKLREAAKEFLDICEKYDCAGVVLFCSPTHSEYVNSFDPSWSVMKFEKHESGGLGIRFRSKREDFKSKQDQDFATEATAHVLTSIVEWSRQTNDIARSLVQALSEKMKIAWRTWDKPDSVPEVET